MYVWLYLFQKLIDICYLAAVGQSVAFKSDGIDDIDKSAGCGLVVKREERKVHIRVMFGRRSVYYHGTVALLPVNPGNHDSDVVILKVTYQNRCCSVNKIYSENETTLTVVEFSRSPLNTTVHHHSDIANLNAVDVTGNRSTQRERYDRKGRNNEGETHFAVGKGAS
jgi:hypothetical protein